MGILQPNQIPGYSEALEREQANRDLAIMPFVPVCGVRCRQISIRSWVLLRQLGNDFLLGARNPRLEHAVIFLWILSPDYSLDEKERRRYIRRVILPALRRLGTTGSIAGINAYLGQAFQDSPGSTSDRGWAPEYVSSPITCVDALAGEYGWSDEAILDMPISRLFLYLRQIQMRRNPQKPVFNPSDRIRGEWLQKLNERRGSN